MRSKRARKREYFLVSASPCKELGSYHCYPYSKKKMDKLKINNFSCTHQRTDGYTGKLPNQNMERQVDPERHSRGLLTLGRSHWSHKLVGKIKW